MSEARQRLYGADFARASACAIVVLHHLAQRIDGRSWLGATEGARAFNAIGGFGVAIFFVLSGFLLARPFWAALDQGGPLPDLRIFALRRAARIVPGFWLALTVTFVLSFTLFGFELDGWLVLRYGAGLLLVSDWHWTTLFPVEINGPLWSIGFEVTSYVLLPLGFALVFAVGGRWRGRLLWLGVIALALGAHWLVVNFVPVDPSRRGWDFGLQGGAKMWMPGFNPFGFFAMFAIGALAAGLQVVLARWRSGLFDVLALAGIVAAGMLMWHEALTNPGDYFALLGVPYAFPRFHLLVALVLATAPSSLVLGRVLDNRLVRYLAQVSFGVYVWHYLVLELVRLFWLPDLVHGGIKDTQTFLLAAALVIGISLTVATLSYRWLEAPVIGWARRLETRISSAAQSTD